MNIPDNKNGLTCNLDVVRAFHGGPGESAAAVANKRTVATVEAARPRSLYDQLRYSGVPDVCAQIIAAKLEGLELRVLVLEQRLEECATRPAPVEEVAVIRRRQVAR